MSLLIDFVAPTALLREEHRPSTLPIVGNGPPGTFVLFPNGLRVSLPTDQIVFADDTGGHARVGFGGMHHNFSKRPPCLAPWVGVVALASVNQRQRALTSIAAK